MVIESDLADGPGVRRPRHLVAHDVGRPLRPILKRLRDVWMDADRKPALRPQRRHAPGLRRFFFIAGFEDRQHALEPRGLRPGNHGIEIGGKHLVGEVAVAVYHRLGAAAVCCCSN